MASTLAGAAAGLLTAVSDALSDDLRPVCKVYQTHGIPVIFQCCECGDEEANGELSVHFRRLMDVDANSLEEVRRVRPCKGGATAAQFRLVLARCRPIINDKGEIPPPDELTEHTQDQLRDAELMWQALACSAGVLRIDDITADLSDPGNCSVMFADVTVEVSVPALPPSGSA